MGKPGRRPGALGVDARTVALAVALGVTTGLVLGYVLMGTAQAVLEVGVEMHYQHGHGPIIRTKQSQGGGAAGGRTIHSVFTSNGSPYLNFQGRIMYGTYKLVQKMPGGEQLTGFTRVLHRMKDDELMDEIPSFRAKPLHPKCDEWCEFPVADRANAFVQWLDALRQEPKLLKGSWILLLEADYVWIKPLAAPDAGNEHARGLAFLFDYIDPMHPDAAGAMTRLSNGSVALETIPKSGPAPVLMRASEWQQVGPAWERVTAALEADKAAVKSLDWVREMYAFDIAVAESKVLLDVKPSPVSSLICQPPHDLHTGNATMYHYTWGPIYMDGTTKVWEFDKRVYTDARHALKVSIIPPPPVWREGLKLQDGLPVTEGIHASIAAMIAQMNVAIATLPDLRVQARPGRRLR